MKPQAQEAHIGIFWDYEDCPVPTNLSGYDIVKQIRNLAHEFGSIKLFKAYNRFSEQTVNSFRTVVPRSELQSSGVSITDCSHSRYKNVANQTIIVDILAFAIDNPFNPQAANTTIMLISGDRDFAYALSILQLRKYNVVVVARSTIHASLRAQTSALFDWDEKILTLPNNQWAGNSYKNLDSNPSHSYSAVADTTAFSPGPNARPSEHPLPYHVLPPGSPTKIHNNRYSQVRSAAVNSRSLPGYNIPHVANYTQTQTSHLSSEPLARPNFDRIPIVIDRSDRSDHYDDERTSSPSTQPLSPGSTKAFDRPKQHTADSVAGPSENGPTVFLPTSSLHSSPPRPRSAEPYISAPTRFALSVTPQQPSSFDYPQLPMQTNAQTFPIPSSPIVDNRGPSTTGIVENGHVYHEGSSHHIQAGEPESSRDPVSSIEPGLPLPIPNTATSSVPPALPFHPNMREPSRTPAPHPADIPPHFLLLVQHLENLRLQGILYPLRSVVSLALYQMDSLIYKRVECRKFKDFVHKAEEKGLIRLGGANGKAWIVLHPDLHGRIEVPEQVAFYKRP
ncbi:NYN domain-containing protein [Lentinula raphanica]|uniref:NYN domain-containing protein n=1 Tax=Lentinula raphanica TaxID=153919 RepID=A0AA38UIJ5_9AGAR|nr:NYN domain-containing protein [Lentinula raphanica]KAJ3974215.1 NYN domain-containing protein [Lentinula raphanica]